MLVRSGVEPDRTFDLNTNMRELWILRYDHWAAPISVEWPDQDDVAAVRVGTRVHLTSIHRKAAEDFLRTIADKRENRWWIMRGDLQKFAQPVDHGDPERCVEWKPYASRRITPRDTPEQDEFIAEFVRNTNFFKSPAEAKVVWFAFCKHCLHWMLNKQRSVNMLFCELMPMPFRPNWKQIVMQMDFRIKRINPRDQTLNKIVERKIHRLMLDNHLVMWDTAMNQIFWTIEVRHSGMWWRMVQAVEAEKYRIRKSTKAYIAEVVDSMRRALPNAIRAYYSHVREIIRPCVILKRRHNRATQFFSKHDRAGKVVSKTVEPHSSPVSIDPADASKKSGVILDSKAEMEFVYGMRDLQSEIENVRDTGGPVEEPHNREGGTEGLHVPDGLRGAREEKVLLALEEDKG